MTDATGETLFRASQTTVLIVGEEPRAAMKKWLVSRSCTYNNRAIAWCIPLELSVEHLQMVVLTRANDLDLELIQYRAPAQSVENDLVG